MDFCKKIEVGVLQENVHNKTLTVKFMGRVYSHGAKGHE